jgi:hypothetical protein
LQARAIANCNYNKTIFLPTQIIGTPKVCHASERSTVDTSERQMTLKTTNVTFGTFLSVDEVLQYAPHPTDPSKTLLKQQATVSVQGVPLSTYMEDVLTKNISFNAGRGRLGLEWVINKIDAEVRVTNNFCIERMTNCVIFPS